MNIKFPAHKCTLYLEHNPNKNVYESVEEYLINNEDYIGKNNLKVQECIESNELWVLHWYPETPIGFHVVIGKSLNSCLEQAHNIEKESKDA